MKEVVFIDDAESVCEVVLDGVGVFAPDGITRNVNPVKGKVLGGLSCVSGGQNNRADGSVVS